MPIAIAVPYVTYAELLKEGRLVLPPLSRCPRCLGPSI